MANLNVHLHFYHAGEEYDFDLHESSKGRFKVQAGDVRLQNLVPELMEHSFTTEEIEKTLQQRLQARDITLQKSDESSKTLQMDIMLQQTVKERNFRGAVLVKHEGRPILCKAYGIAREGGEPNTTNTVFSIGSISKQFVGAAI